MLYIYFFNLFIYNSLIHSYIHLDCYYIFHNHNSSSSCFIAESQKSNHDDEPLGRTGMYTYFTTISYINT